MTPKEIRISDHFQLFKSQAELDFVDVPVKGDVRLFVDPYAFTLEPDPWFVECNDLIVDFFTVVIESIRANQTDKAFQLLSNLHEPDDTHLGFSKVGSSGRGIGRNQAEYLLDALKASRAVQTGALADITDCELLIFGISADKISDITTNIIRRPLLEYTESQCLLHSIPMMKVAGGVHWDLSRQRWVNGYAPLPVVNGKKLLLVPKACVRLRPEINAEDYYNGFVLEFLRAENLHSNTSLVETLKDGSKRVQKKTLREKFPLTKDYLLDFSMQHPEVLLAYKAKVRERSRPLRDQDVESHRDQSREIEYGKMAQKLDAIPTGPQSASEFHNHILGVLQALFYPGLRSPKKEAEIHDGRKRIDISFNRGSRSGFFGELPSHYNVVCPFIFFECKNYSSDPANPELDQLTGRFSDKRGEFGIMVCRKIEDRTLMLERCKDALRDNRGWILVFDDSDIKALLELRDKGMTEDMDKFMHEKMRELVM